MIADGFLAWLRFNPWAKVLDRSCRRIYLLCPLFDDKMIVRTKNLQWPFVEDKDVTTFR
jgi:hypothetical protein